MKLGLCAALLVVACSDPAPQPAPDQPPPHPGRALVVRYECVRCHAMDDVPAAEAHADCVACHREIADGSFDAPADALREWRSAVMPLTHTPSLRNIGARLRRSWIEQFLLHPVDLRPGLVPTMPRLDMSPADAAVIADYLAPHSEESPPERNASATLSTTQVDDRQVDRGRALYRTRTCGRCHTFSGSGEPSHSEPSGEIARRLAPDLRYARERLRPGVLVRWLQDPRRVDPNAIMPATNLSDEDALALATFLMFTPLAPEPPSAMPTRLPVLERPVAWPEVEARVFRRICWHCHSDPDFALGDGGPGNHGGFGFAARGVDLSSYEAVLAGGVDGDGRVESLFRRNAAGTPRLVETLLARQSEEAGRERPGVRGMPLGLPALSPEDVQLIETWIAQGRPM